MEDGHSDDGNGLDHLMELDLLKHKIRRLVAKLQKHDVHLQVFEPEDLEYGNVIGKGGEGVVRKCTINYQGIVHLEAAVKTLSDNSSDAISLTLEEIELLCLAQDHIFATTVKVYGMAAVPDEDNPEFGQLVILTEAGIMNALQLYQDRVVPLGVTLDFMSRLAAAMHLIHSKKIIHQDLKPENILITGLKEDENRTVEKIDFRIIDMGMARRVYTDKVITDDILGTNGYHPPEVLFEDGYDFRADIFMLGITFAVMLHNPMFLRAKDLPGLLKKLHDAKMQEVAGKKLFEEIIESGIEQKLPAPVKKLLCSMMECQDKRSITLADITHTCKVESDKLITLQADEPPVLQPRCLNCNDSGFGMTSTSSQLENRRFSSGNDSRVSKRKLVAASARAPRSRRRSRMRHKRRRDDTSPTVSMSSTRTCMTGVSTSSSKRENQRETRAMKRFRSDMQLDWLDDLDNMPRKRTRLGTVRD